MQLVPLLLVPSLLRWLLMLLPLEQLLVRFLLLPAHTQPSGSMEGVPLDGSKGHRRLRRL